MHKFADLIDVQAYDARTSTFICSSNYLGYVWQTEPLSFVNDDVERQLKAILQIELPDNSHLSFTLIADDNLTSSFANYQALRQQVTQIPAIAKSTEARLNFLRSKQQFSTDIYAPCNLRNYILVISLKLGYKGSLSQQLLGQYQQYAAQIQAALEITFGAVATRRLDARGYLFLMRNLLLSKDYQGIAQLDPIFNYYDQEKTIAEQIFSPSSHLKVYNNALELNNQLVQVFSPLEIPLTFACGQAVNYIGDLLTGITPLTQKFFLTTNLYFANAASVKAAFERKRTWTIKQSFGPLARFLPRLNQTSENFDIIEGDLNNGDRLLKMSWTLVAWVPETDTQQLQQTITTKASYTGDYSPNLDQINYQDKVNNLESANNLDKESNLETVNKTETANSLNTANNQEITAQERRLEEMLALKRLAVAQENLTQRLARAQAFAVKVKSYFQTLGWLLDNETAVNLPVFLNSLPLCLEHNARNILERHRTLSTTQVVVCLPVFAEWKATTTAMVPLISRTG